VDPHTAVAVCVARKLGYPRDGRPCVIAATATPYKFPETCLRAFGEDVLNDPPPAIAALEGAPVTQRQVVDVDEIDAAVRALFACFPSLSAKLFAKAKGVWYTLWPWKQYMKKTPAAALAA